MTIAEDEYIKGCLDERKRILKEIERAGIEVSKDTMDIIKGVSK